VSIRCSASASVLTTAASSLVLLSPIAASREGAWAGVARGGYEGAATAAMGGEYAGVAGAGTAAAGRELGL